MATYNYLSESGLTYYDNKLKTWLANTATVQAATKLATARNISVSGDVITATAQSFDGTAPITIPLTIADVTTTAHGLMTAAQKNRLDAITDDDYKNVIEEIKLKYGDDLTPATISNLVAILDMSAFAKLDSPVLTGTPKAVTGTTGDNTTMIATNAFVNASIAAIPDATSSVHGYMSAADKAKMDGIEAGAQVNDIENIYVKYGENDTDVTAVVDTTNKKATLDLSAYAKLNSPALTGTPTAPTAVYASDTTSKQIATMEYVANAAKTIIAEQKALVYKGTAAGTADLPADAKVGYTYIATAKFTMADGRVVEPRDMIICSGVSPIKWDIVEGNVTDGVTSKSAASVEGNIVVFGGTNGREIKESNFAFANLIEKIRQWDKDETESHLLSFDSTEKSVTIDLRAYAKQDYIDSLFVGQGGTKDLYTKLDPQPAIGDDVTGLYKSADGEKGWTPCSDGEKAVSGLFYATKTPADTGVIATRLIYLQQQIDELTGGSGGKPISQQIEERIQQLDKAALTGVDYLTNISETDGIINATGTTAASEITGSSKLAKDSAVKTYVDNSIATEVTNRNTAITTAKNSLLEVTGSGDSKSYSGLVTEYLGDTIGAISTSTIDGLFS